MTDTFNPAEELRRHGLYGGAVSPATDEIISTLTAPQVRAIVEVGAPEVQGHENGLALAMTRVMGWDRPQVQETGGEVEGMSAPPVAECACLCTGGGGGGGSN